MWSALVRMSTCFLTMHRIFIFPTIYSAPCTPEGGVRLTGSDRPSRGTVGVCISGTWSTVCGNFWNIPDARVVCRQLGYGSQGEFPRTIDPVSQDEYSSY